MQMTLNIFQAPEVKTNKQTNTKQTNKITKVIFSFASTY